MDDYLRKPHHHPQKRSCARLLLTVLLLVAATNMVTYYLAADSSLRGIRLGDYAPGLHLWDTATLLRELNATQAKLAVSQVQLSELHRRLTTSNTLLETLLAEIGRQQAPPAVADGWRKDLPPETKLAVQPHKLPFGHNANFGTDEIRPVLGAACMGNQEELLQYMTYKVGGECPVDDVFAQRLMLKGCEPLPRRRCRPKAPVGYVEPTPLPRSLWSTPPDTSIVWEPYTCKSYGCLEKRRHKPGTYDCKDCFELSYRENTRWLTDTDGVDYGIDAVLATRTKGTVRIGLDIGGGAGTFAARMWERNITVVTTSMNFDGPFNSFIASRGLVPLHISVSHRLPFFENTLDIVHSMHVLSSWIPVPVLEFALYDVYRVLRPGGVFWLDHFFCLGSDLNSTFAPLLEGVGFNKIRWNTARKLDKGIGSDEWYLSALLEKPIA